MTTHVLCGCGAPKNHGRENWRCPRGKLVELINMGRKFIFPNSSTAAQPSAPSPHPSGFGIVASEKTKSAAQDEAEKMADTTQFDIQDARDWLKRQGLDEAVAMFDASVK